MKQLPFQQSDPVHKNFQFLEDLATAYWYSEVLFAAIELDLFGWIEKGYHRMETLAEAAGCRMHEFGRMMRVLRRLELVYDYDGQWFNNRISQMYLVDSSPDYMGDFFLYRQYMKPQWSDLLKKVSRAHHVHSTPLSADDDYEVRNFHYVRSLDRLIRQKAREIISLFSHLPWKGPVLDIGGGAGTLARELTNSRLNDHAVLVDLPEVIRAARLIYPDSADWKQIHAVAGDFRFYPFSERRFGLIVMSNFLHAYSQDTARHLLEQAIKLLRPDGFVLIHDYMPDRFGKSPHKGPLYDLNMMLNTYDGQCHDTAKIMDWLKTAGMNHLAVHDLQTDTSVIIGSFNPLPLSCKDRKKHWRHVARNMGFADAKFLASSDIVTAAWVRIKCRFGCGGYGKNLQCPPHTLSHSELREVLASYSLVLMIQGSPPGRDFHKKLLELEKRAFLDGFHKALVFGAGPCPVCDSCPGDPVCRNPEKARPSMEACGIDVYETAHNAGFRIEPVCEKQGYVKYFGLLLME